MQKDKSHPGSSIFLLGFAIIAVLALHIWIFWNNSVFADSLELVTLRESDEYIFQLSLYKLNSYFENKEWFRFFSFTEYNYGNLYWVGTYLFTKIGFLIDSAKTIIILPRQLSLIGFAFSLTAIFTIGCRLGAYKSQMVLVLLFICTFAAPVEAAGKFHNHTIHLMLMLWSCYLAMGHSKKLKIFAAFLFGCAFGLKSVALAFLPVFFLFLNKSYLFDERREGATEDAPHLPSDGIFTNIIAFLLILLVGLFVFLPAAFFSLSKGQTLSLPFENLLYAVLIYPRSSGITGTDLFSILQNFFFSQSIHFALFLVLFFTATFQAMRSYSYEKKINFLPLVLLMSSICLFILALKPSLYTRGLSFYSLPFMFILPLGLTLFPVRKSVSLGMIFALSMLNLYLNHKPYWKKIIENYDLNEKYKDDIALYRSRHNILDIAPGEKIYMDAQVLFPLESEKNFNSIVIISDLFNVQLVSADILILDKKEFLKSRECSQDDDHETYYKNCLFLQNIQSANSPLENTFEDQSTVVFKRRRTP